MRVVNRKEKREWGGEKDYTKKALYPILLSGSNPKKPLTQNNVNKDHIFIKKKKIISLCSITSKGKFCIFWIPYM